MISQITALVDRIKNSAVDVDAILLGLRKQNLLRKLGDYSPDNQNKTPLYIALENRNYTAAKKIIKSLPHPFIDKGQILQVESNLQQTPLLLAVSQQDVEAVALLVGSAQVENESAYKISSNEDELYRYPIELAYELKNVEIFKLLADAADYVKTENLLEFSNFSQIRQERIIKSLKARNRYHTTGEIVFTEVYAEDFSVNQAVNRTEVKNDELGCVLHPEPYKLTDLENSKATEFDISMDLAKNKLAFNLQKQELLVPGKSEAQEKQASNYHQILITDTNLQGASVDFADQADKNPIARLTIENNVCTVEILAEKVNLDISDVSKFDRVVIIGHAAQLKLDVSSKAIRSLEICVKEFKLPQGSKLVAKHAKITAVESMVQGHLLVASLELSGKLINRGQLTVANKLMAEKTELVNYGQFAFYKNAQSELADFINTPAGQFQLSSGSELHCINNFIDYGHTHLHSLSKISAEHIRIDSRNLILENISLDAKKTFYVASSADVKVAGVVVYTCAGELITAGKFTGCKLPNREASETQVIIDAYQIPLFSGEYDLNFVKLKSATTVYFSKDLSVNLDVLNVDTPECAIQGSFDVQHEFEVVSNKIYAKQNIQRLNCQKISIFAIDKADMNNESVDIISGEVGSISIRSADVNFGLKVTCYSVHVRADFFKLSQNILVKKLFHNEAALIELDEDVKISGRAHIDFSAKNIEIRQRAGITSETLRCDAINFNMKSETGLDSKTVYVSSTNSRVNGIIETEVLNLVSEDLLEFDEGTNITTEVSYFKANTISNIPNSLSTDELVVDTKSTVIIPNSPAFYCAKSLSVKTTEDLIINTEINHEQHAQPLLTEHTITNFIADVGGNIILNNNIVTDKIMFKAQGKVLSTEKIKISTTENGQIVAQDIDMQCAWEDSGEKPLLMNAEKSLMLNNSSFKMSADINLSANTSRITTSEFDCKSVTIDGRESSAIQEVTVTAATQVTLLGKNAQLSKSKIQSDRVTTNLESCKLINNHINVINDYIFQGQTLSLEDSKIIARNTNINSQKFLVDEKSVVSATQETILKNSEMKIAGELRLGLVSLIKTDNLLISKSGKITKSSLLDTEHSSQHGNNPRQISIETNTYIQRGKVLLGGCDVRLKANHSIRLLPSVDSITGIPFFPRFEADKLSMTAPIIIDIFAGFDITTIMSAMSLVSLSLGSFGSVWTRSNASLIAFDISTLALPNFKKLGVMAHYLANANFKQLHEEIISTESIRKVIMGAIGVLKMTVPQVGQVAGLAIGTLNTILQLPELKNVLHNFATKNETVQLIDMIPVLVGLKSIGMGAFNQYNSAETVAMRLQTQSLFKQANYGSHLKTAVQIGQVGACLLGPTIINDSFISISGPGASFTSNNISNSFLSFKSPGRYEFADTYASTSYSAWSASNVYADNVAFKGHDAKLVGEIHAQDMLAIEMDDKLVIGGNQHWDHAVIESKQIVQQGNVHLRTGMITADDYTVKKDVELSLKEAKLESEHLIIDGTMVVDHGMVGTHDLDLHGTYLSQSSSTVATNLNESRNGAIISNASAWTVGHGVLAGSNNFTQSHLQVADLTLTQTSTTTVQMSQVDIQKFSDNGQTNFIQDQIHFGVSQVGATGHETYIQSQVDAQEMTNAGSIQGKEVEMHIEELETDAGSRMDLRDANVKINHLTQASHSEISFKRAEVDINHAVLNGETKMDTVNAKLDRVTQGSDGNWTMRDTQAELKTYDQQGVTKLENSLFEVHNHVIGQNGVLDLDQSKYEGSSLILNEQSHVTAQQSLVEVNHLNAHDQAKIDSRDSSIQVKQEFTYDKDTKVEFTDSELKAEQVRGAGELDEKNSLVEVNGSIDFTNTSTTETEHSQIQAQDIQFEGELNSHESEFDTQGMMDFRGHSEIQQSNFIAQGNIEFESTETSKDTDAYFKANTIIDEGSNTEVGSGYYYLEANNIDLNNNTNITGSSESITAINSLGLNSDLRGNITTGILQIHDDSLNYNQLLNAGGQYAHFQPSENLIYDTNRDVTITGFNRSQGVMVTANTIFINADCYSGKDLAFQTKTGDLTARANLHGETSLSLIAARNLYTGVDTQTVLPPTTNSKSPSNLTNSMLEALAKGGVETSRTSLQPTNYNYTSNGVVYLESGGDYINQKGNVIGLDIFIKTQNDMINNGGSYVAARDIGAQIGGSFYNNTFKDTHYEKVTYHYGNDFLDRYYGTQYVKVDTNNVAQFVAGNNISFDVAKDINNHGGIIAANNIVQLKAGGSINNISFADNIASQKFTGNSLVDSFISRIFGNQNHRADIYNTAQIMGSEVLLEAGQDIDNDAGFIAATQYLQAIAKGSIYNRCQEQKYWGGYDTRTRFLPGQFVSGSGTEETNGVGMCIKAGNQVVNDASSFISQGDLYVEGQNGIISTPREYDFLAYHHESDSGFFGNKHKEVSIYDWDVQKATFGSSEGRVILNSPNGTINLTATDIISSGGADIYGKYGVGLYDIVVGRKEYVSKSSLWGLSSSETRRYDEYSVPTVVANYNPGVTRIHSDEGAINMRGTVVMAPGSVDIEGKEINISVSKLHHTIDYERDDFTFSALGFNLIGGKQTDFSDLFKPDSTYQSMGRLFNSNDALSMALNSWNLVADLVNTTSTLMYAMQGNVFGALSSRYLGGFSPSVRFGYDHEESHFSYETMGEGGIYTDNLTLKATDGDVNVTGAQIVVSHDMDVSAKNFNLSGMALNTDFSSTNYSVGVSVMPGAHLAADASVGHSEMSAQNWGGQMTYVGGNLHVEVDNMNLDATQLDVGSISGHVTNELTIKSEVDSSSFTSWSASASTTGAFSASYAHGSSEAVSTGLSGIHSHESITDQGENAFVIGKGEITGGYLTSDKEVNISAPIETHEIHTSSSSVSFGISGNFKDIVNCFDNSAPAAPTSASHAPSQLQTVNVSVGIKDSAQINHTVIGGQQGTHVNVNGNYVTNMNDRVEVTHQDERQYDAKIVLPNQYNFNLFKDFTKTIGDVATGHLPTHKVDPVIQKLEHRLGLDGKPVETMEKVKTAQTFSKLAYEDDYGAEQAAEMGFETTEIARDDGKAGYAVLYQNSETNEAYIVFRGTASKEALEQDAYIAYGTDIPLVCGTEFDQAVRATADALLDEGWDVRFAGHSLGATIADYYASFYANTVAFGFDSPGLPALDNGEQRYDNAYNFQSPSEDLINSHANLTTGADYGNVIYLPETGTDFTKDLFIRTLSVVVPELNPLLLAVDILNNHFMEPIEDRVDAMVESMKDMQQSFTNKM